MKAKAVFTFLFCLSFWFCNTQNQAEFKTGYDSEKKYSVKKLQEDFVVFREALLKNHPRLYEFTPENTFDSFMDSIYNSLYDMNEMEFRHKLALITARVHCSHTYIAPSKTLNENFTSYSKYPPFKLYFEKGKAFILYNFSGDALLKPGTEVVMVNEIPVSTIISNFLQRTSMEGIHPHASYAIMNQPHVSLYFGIWNYYQLDAYKLKIAEGKEITVKSIKHDAYKKAIEQSTKPKVHKLEILDANTAVLTYPMFMMFEPDFISGAFKTLQEKKITNLIIDLRGNGGGPGEVAGYMLQHVMKNKFTYYNDSTTTGGGYPEYRKDIELAPNHFNGKLYCLVDANCFSSSGHFLSMVKYYKCGTIIGQAVTAGYSCNGNGSPHELPNTNLVLYCSTNIYETTAKGLKRADGILPDHEVNTTLNDVLTNNDPVMKFTLGLIKEGK